MANPANSESVLYYYPYQNNQFVIVELYRDCNQLLPLIGAFLVQSPTVTLPKSPSPSNVTVLQTAVPCPDAPVSLVDDSLLVSWDGTFNIPFNVTVTNNGIEIPRLPYQINFGLCGAGRIFINDEIPICPNLRRSLSSSTPQIWILILLIVIVGILVLYLGTP